MMPDFPIIKRGKKQGLKTIDSALDHFFSLMGGRAGAVENCTTFFSNPSPNKLNNHRRILKKIYQTLRLPPGMLKIQKKFGWCGGFCGYKIFIVQGCITPAKLRCVSDNMYFKIFNTFLNIFFTICGIYYQFNTFSICTVNTGYFSLDHLLQLFHV